MPVAGRLLTPPGWAAVLGSPIGHTLSPVLHRAAWASLGPPYTSWSYTARECAAGALPEQLRAARADPGWVGLSLTMPLKAAVLPLLDEVSPVAAEVGAVNTVLPREGRLLGDNTDVAGLRAALVALALPPGPVAVLGAGGTASAAVAALTQLGRGEDVRVHARRPQPALLRAPVLPWASFDPRDVGGVVTTTPAGATDALAARGWPAGTALLEVLYDPWPTPLAAAAALAGAPVVGGLEVLVGQAVEQVALMTGQRVEPAVLRAAGAAALAGRARAT